MHPIDNIVQPAFQQNKEVLASLPRHCQRLLKSIAELCFLQAIRALQRLFFSQLSRIFRLFASSRLRRFPRGKPFFVYWAFVALAAITFKKELLLLNAAKPAYRSSISCHFPFTPCQIRRALRGLQPLWGMGVTSFMDLTLRPRTPSCRIADSRPIPGPFT